MRIGFYAPLKAPDHPTPSGDRAMARALIELLEALGHEVVLLCRLRSFDRNGNRQRQERVRNLGSRAVRILEKRHERCDLVFTYHLYHKAPDWIGLPIARYWNVPYIVAEASIADKQAGGLWDLGYHGSRKAIASADHVLAMTDVDRQALSRYTNRITLLRPFTRCPSEMPERRKHDVCALLAVAMMRFDVKLQSYRLLADSLARIAHLPWTLTVVGDGPAKAEVRRLFSGLGDRVDFVGALSSGALTRTYQASDLLVWPGLNEAYGMVYLEAQAHGLPVVAWRNAGVGEVIWHNRTGLLVAEANPDAFALAVGSLLDDAENRQTMGRQAHRFIRQRHDRRQACATIAGVLDAATGGAG